MISPSFSQQLLSWYRAYKRDLPWRATNDPYAILVSEIMLQQTQVERVKDYFTRWLEIFPDISALAQADEETVFKQWEGLGYYARARNLHHAAKLLCHGNKEIPDSRDELLSLPGIGPYTAAAVLSIAFNKDEPLVDANVERVLSRYCNVASPVKSREAQEIFWQTVGELLPSGKAGEFNQALMELGALVCLKKNPHCSSCPVRQGCQAYCLGITNQRPVQAPRKKIIPIDMACGVLEDDGLFFIQKRLKNDVWAGLWEFPGGCLKDNEIPADTVIREYREETELEVHNIRPIETVQHSYMNYRVTLHGFLCDLKKKKQQPVLHAAQECRWVEKTELDNYAFPAGHRKLISLL